MNSLTVEIDAGEEKARAVISAIHCELESDTHERSTVKIDYDGKLVLSIEAADLAAMRAAANTYLRFVDMCMKLADDPF